MKIIKKIITKIPGFRQLSSQSMIIAATYYGVALFTMVQYWYWGLVLVAIPFLVFYLLDLNAMKNRHLPLVVSIVAGLCMLLGTATGLTSGGEYQNPAFSHIADLPAPAASTPMNPLGKPAASLSIQAASSPVSSASSRVMTASPAPGFVVTETLEKGQYAFVSAKGGKVFHLPGCSSVRQIKPENLIGYASRDEATAAGLQPCKRCKP